MNKSRQKQLGSWFRVLNAVCASSVVLGLHSRPLGAQVPAPSDSIPTSRAPLLWVRAGLGAGSVGLVAVAGGTLAFERWSIAGLYMKNASSGGFQVDRYAEHKGVLVGRLLGSTRRAGVAAGFARS